MAEGNIQRSFFRQSALEYITVPKALDDLIQVTSIGAWLWLTAIWLMIAGVCVWLVFGSLAKHVVGKGIMLTPNQGVVYVSALNSQYLKAGMNVEIAPLTEKSWESRHIKGVVTEVAIMPATPENMQTILQNSVLVNYFLSQGPVVSLNIQLTADQQHLPSYWRTTGLLIDARITVRRRTPLTIFFSSHIP